MEVFENILVISDIKQSVLFCPIVKENKLPVALILEMK